MTEKTPGRIQVLMKCVAVLDLLAEQNAATAAEIAEHIEEPRSTVYRLLETLQAVGYVEAGSGRGTYQLGLDLFRLGHAVAQRFDSRSAARPVMKRLHEETEQTVFLTVRKGFEAVCIERVEGRWVQLMALQLGGSLPLHIGAGPRVLLAAQEDAFIDSYLDGRTLLRLTDHTLIAPQAVRSDVDTTRSRGYSISDEDDVLGMAAIGAPIRMYDGAVTAALSLSGPKPAILAAQEAPMIELVTDAASEISRMLGYAAA